MHVEKYDRGAVSRMFAHYDRSHPGSKSNIDTAKTALNYNAAAEDQPLAQSDFLAARLSQVKVQNRKDVNVMCDWIITAPQTLEEHEYDIFFRETYRFMSGRYGKENIVSAYVHMDETQPHMHFSFIPVTMDKKKHRPKVCAKELLNRQELRTIHDDINSFMTEVFGRDIGMRNGATALGNVTVDTLRKNRAKVKAVQDTVISGKTAELEKVRNSPAGKIFKKDTVTINSEELEHLQDVMQESTAIADKADNILQQAEDQRYRAQQERIIAEEIRQRTEEYAREEQKKAESKTKELEDREHSISVKEQAADDLMYEAKRMYEQQHDLNERYDNLDRKCVGLERKVMELTSDNHKMDKMLLDKEQELEKVKDEMEKKQKRADDTHNADQERIRTLEKSEREYITKINGLERTIVQKDEEIEKKDRVCSIWEKLYDAAIEVGQYICKIFRLPFNFEKCVDMRSEGYRLNYIFDEDRTR